MMPRAQTGGYSAVQPDDETRPDMPAVNQNAATVEWIYKGVLTICVGLGAWFGAEVWSGQKEIAKSLDQRIRMIELSAAETSGNRFSSKDWTQAKMVLDNQLADDSKRIYQLEITTKAIEKSLDRIESKLGTK